MKTTSINSPNILEAPIRPGILDRFARWIVKSRLKHLKYGQVVVKERGSVATYGELGDECPLTAVICVNDPEFYGDLAFGGSIGAGESYMQGHWRCDELSILLRIMLLNRDVLENIDSGMASFIRPARKALHWLNRNTRSGSRKNIAAHYDLGNDFYALWLDSKMMYSCAYFESADMSLEAAATAKLERICRKLNLSEADSVIEIGTGWGGFAIYAAENHGCHVTTTTISREQYDLAKQRIAAAGLEDRITLLFDDYRDLEGQYDKLVSIEMIEAVGHQFHSSFFEKCAALLKPDGQMLLQAITIADQQYDSYKKGVDFIRRYIFPGGCLTSVTDMTRVMTDNTDIRTIHVEDIGSHYAYTLRHWHDRFFDKLDTVREMQYPDAFIRMWQYYLCYCESAFVERAIGTVQMLLVKPAARRHTISY
ncbi:MAG: class I SAM-dependent methyltransferase [Woeseiaceae bacterium]